MNCKVQFVYKTIRYRLLTINGQHYIIDMERPLWYIIFPFAFWFFPHKVFKLQDENILKQMKKPKVNQSKTSLFSIFGAGVSLLLANLIRPVMDYFNIQGSMILNSIIIFSFIALIVLLRFYLSIANKKSLRKTVRLEELHTERLWIGPKSIKYFFVYLFYYIFFLAFAVMVVWLYIDYGNLIILLSLILITFCLLIGNIATVVPGNTRVRFSHSKKVV